MSSEQTNLTQIPGIGPKMAQRLIDVGYPDIASLKGQDPDEIYMRVCLSQGMQECRCTLYCYRLAVAYADSDGVLPPGKLNWHDWKDA